MGTAAGLLGCLLLTALLGSSNAGLVNKVLRHRRQTLAPPEAHRLALPSAADRPVVFNHVYNIDVPATSLCSVDVDSPESVPLQPKDATNQTTEHTVDGENQIVFIHRINIPRQACGCSDDASLLKDLMSRLEMLEGEVSALRDRCDGDTACCGAPATGKVGTKPYCNGHGNYSSETCGCVCEPGWKGPNCTEPACPSSCQDRGRCIDGKCDCFQGFAGEDCALTVCPVDCGANGQCVGGVCVCLEGFFGEDCSGATCPDDCRRRGRCSDGGCVCEDPWTGLDCSELACPKGCLDRGLCLNGTCHCEEGYTGKDCGELDCPNGCHGNGLCADGQCVCVAGFGGRDCSRPTCLRDCSGRGTCFNGVCVCDAGYQGEDCSQVACPNDCNNRGQCINGRCACDVAFRGDDCAELSCPNSCLHRGRCVNGQCVCDEGFAGEDCRVSVCPSDCHGRGDCNEGRCACHAGFTGEDCSELSCPSDCLHRGRCVNGQCVCDEGFVGEDCSRKACPNDCLARGRCVDGSCVCQEGYAGDDCSALVCPANCNSRGRCFNGSCVCESGYQGESCAELSCPNGCQDKGRCVKGRCVCDEGYIGEDCSEVSSPKDLTVGEVSSDTVALSWSNEMLVTEYLVTYVPTGPGGLQQEFNVSGDKSAATVQELEPGIEYLIKVYAILSNKRSVPVSARVATALPRPEGLIFKSVRETSVEVVWDQLDFPFDGWEIYFRNTKEENGKVVSTLPPSQNRFIQSGLGPGQEYDVSVYIIKNNTRGAKASRTVTTKIDRPQQVEVTAVTDSSALVSWSPPVAPADRVTVFYGPVSDPSEETSVEILPPDKQCSIDGLRPDTGYKVSLVSRSGDATSDPVTATFTTALDAPADLQAVSQTEGSITLEWTNSRAHDGVYRVKYSPISGATHAEEVFPRGPGDTTRATLTGLRPGTEYGIGVTTVRNESESLPATMNAETDIDPPRDFRAVESTGTSLTLRWQKPRAKVGAYRLAFVPEDGQAEEEEAEIPGTATGHVLSPLTPGMSYSITLTAERGLKRSTAVALAASTAPKSTSPDVLPLSIKDAPITPQSVLDIGAVRTPNPLRPLNTEAPLAPEADAMSSESDSSRPDPLDDLAFTVTPANVSPAWPTFDGAAWVGAPPRATQGRVTTPPGSGSGPEIEGLSPSKQNDDTLQGTVEGRRSVPLTDFATTDLPEAAKPTVTNLTVSDNTWDGFTASWTPVGGEFDSFIIEVTNLDNFAESQNLTLSGGALSLGISGLNPNTSYMIGLFGMHQGSLLEPLYIEATTVNQPVVGNVFVSNVTPESFSILWNGTEGEVDGYILEIIDSEWLMEPKEYNISHNVKSYHVPGLRPGTDYVAYLYGTYKGSRTGAVSVVASTAAEPDLSGLVVSNITSDRFSLSWRTGGKAFDNFIVEVRESALPSQAMGRALPGDVRSTVMVGLKASTGYDIKLYASAGGQNTAPLFDVATTEDVPQLGPVAASSASPHDLSLSWSTLSGHFDGFIVRVSDPEQQADPLEFRLPGDARNITVSNLMDATGYDIELCGISHGRHAPSVLAHAVTAPLPKVENLTVSDITPYGFRVSWGVKEQQQEEQEEEDSPPAGGTFRHFHIVVTDSGRLLEPQEFTVLGNQSHLDIWGLITGIGYEVRLTGVSESGLLSRPLTTVAVTEAEPEVEHLFVSDITADGFRLSWTSDEDTFDRFLIKIRDSKRLAHPQEYSVGGGERTKVLTGLLSGTEYEIELCGIALDQRSQPITGVAQTGLSSPQGLHFSEVTDSSAVVRWSMPRSPVDRYRVAYVPVGGGSPMTASVDGGVFEASLSNMAPGETYQVTVSSVKGLEESEPSADTVTTALDRPQALAAVNVTDTSALLLWQPSVATVDGYVITCSAASGPPTAERVSGNAVEFEMSSLAPGTRYRVGVHAVREAQRSDSAVAEFTTDVDPPRELTAANVQTDSASLTWKPPHAAVTGYTLTFSSSDGTTREVALSPTASSYSMAPLTGSTEYHVRLQAIGAGAQRSRHVSTVFTTVGQLHRRPKDCAEILLNGETTSGLHTIYVGGVESQALQVYCDMTTDGGGWMVFLRRRNGKLEFYRNWKNYTAGFGNLNHEFWLGLTNLHKITNSGHYELRVDLRDHGESAFAQYDKFTVAEPRTRYKLYIGRYSGTAGDSMTYHQGRPFSTYDNDNDIAVTNCALSYKGAFWYKNCHRVNLMGKYGDSSHSKGINWFHWKGHEHSIQFAEMKIRPANFGGRKRTNPAS